MLIWQLTRSHACLTQTQTHMLTYTHIYTDGAHARMDANRIRQRESVCKRVFRLFQVQLTIHIYSESFHLYTFFGNFHCFYCLYLITIRENCNFRLAIYLY